MLSSLRPGTRCALLALLFTSGQAWSADAVPPPKGVKASVAAALQAPLGLAVSATPEGLLLVWQPSEQAASFRVLRGTGVAPAAPALATLPKGATTYLDKGNTGNASYQVVAVGADGQVAASVVVQYTSKPAMVAPTKPMTQALLRPPLALGATASVTAIPGTTPGAAPGPAVSIPKGAALAGAAAVGLRVDAPIAFARSPLPNAHGIEMRNARKSDISGKFVKAGAAIPFKPFQLDEIFDVKTGKPLFALTLPATAAAGVSVTRSANQDLAAMAQRRGIRDFSVGTGGSFELKADGAPFSLASRLVLPRKDGSSITLPAVHFLQELNAVEKGLNAQGHSLRDPSTGKLATGARETSVQKFAIDRSKVDRQRQDMDRRFIRNLSDKPWAATEVSVRHRAAMARVAPLRALKGGHLVGTVAAHGSSSAAVARAPRAATAAPGVSRIAGGLRVPPAGGIAALKNAVSCPEVITTQSGAKPGEKFVFKAVAFDPAQCVLTFLDKAGAALEQPTTAAGASAGTLEATVPGLTMGPGYVYFRAKASGWDGAPAAYYIGELCSLDAVYPPIGMPGMKVDLALGRFDDKSCEIYLVDKLNMETRATVHTTAEALAGASADSKNPNNYRNLYTMDVPEFTLGKVRVQSRAVKKAAMRTGGGLMEQTGATLSGTRVATVQSTLVNSVDFKIIPAATDANGNAPPPDYFSRDLTPFWRELPVLNQMVGDPNNIAAGIDAGFKIFTRGKADDNIVRFEGDAAVHAYLFGNGTEVIGAHAKASMPTAKTEKDNKFHATFNISVEEESIYSWNKVKMAEAGENGEADVCNASEKDVLGNCCDNLGADGLCTAGVGVTVGFQYEKEFKKEVDRFVEFYFETGILPVVGRLGFRGDVGAKLHFAASPLQLVGRVTPFVHTSAYAECAVDALIAQAGVGVNLVLADLSLDAAGAAYLDFGQMQIKTDFYVYLDYNFLDGTVYVFLDMFHGNKLKWTLFDINDLISQNTSLDMSKFRGKVYLAPPGSISKPLVTQN